PILPLAATNRDLSSKAHAGKAPKAAVAKLRRASHQKSTPYPCRPGASSAAVVWTTIALDRAAGGTSQRNSAVAAPAPRSCARMNAGTSAGRIPAKVSLAERASVTAVHGQFRVVEQRARQLN